MEKQYILISNNIWEIVEEKNELYFIHTRGSNRVIDKELCESQIGSKLLKYNGDIEITKLVKMNCKNCLYVGKCEDAYSNVECEWFLDFEDDRLDGEIDRVGLIE